MGTPDLEPRQNFIRAVSRPTDNINLPLAALYIAAEEDPDIDVTLYMGKLSHIAQQLRAQLSERDSIYSAIYAINDILFQRFRFRGNTGNYYDIRNSYLHQVLDRKTGIPITLSIIYIEVARRAGIALSGVNMSGHFILSAGKDASLIYIDPFRKGRIYTRWEALQAMRRDGGLQPNESVKLDRLQRVFLPHADKRAILARLLNNMKIIHTAQGKLEAAISAAERVQILMPRNWRNVGDIAQLQAKSGNARDAYRNLSLMVQLMPADVDPSMHLDALELLKPLAESDQYIDPKKIHQIPFFRI